MNLFAPQAQWAQAATRVSVFKIYSDILTGGEVTGPGLSDNELQQIFSFLQQHNIDLALEFPPLTPTQNCSPGVEGFQGLLSVQAIVNRLQRVGGVPKYVAMDHPFDAGNTYTGPGACHWTPQQVAQNAQLSLNVLRSAFPGLLIGDVESSPNGAAQVALYAAWMDAFEAAAGTKLAFLHEDTGGSATWVAEVAAMRKETSNRGIPLGIIYTGFPNDSSDAQWLTHVQQHFLDFELSEGPPDQAILQSWTAYPLTNLPETTPYTFTWLLDQYARPRTSLSLSATLTQASGKLLSTAGAPVASAPVTVTLSPIAGPGIVSSYTLTGFVPTGATSALVGVRINEECSCSGTADVAMYTFQYSETGAGSLTANRDFSSGLNGWGLFTTGSAQVESTTVPPGKDLHVTAGPSQVVQLNSSSFSVTSGATYTLQIKARVSPQSSGTGYFMIIFLAPSEIGREPLNLQSGTVILGTAQTGSDGSYSLQFQAQSGDPTQLRIQSNYAGIDYPSATALWPARVRAYYGPRPKPPSQLTSQ